MGSIFLYTAVEAIERCLSVEKIVFFFFLYQKVTCLSSPFSLFEWH